MPEFMLYPVDGKAVAWIEDAQSPGRKGEESARRKMRDNHGGQAEGLTDLARITLVFTSFIKMYDAVERLRNTKGFEIM